MEAMALQALLLPYRPLQSTRYYRVVPGHRNWQRETADWIWPVSSTVFKTRWLGVRKTCGIGLFYRNYRPLLQETGWLGSDFISMCLETRCLGQNPWFLSPGTTLYYPGLRGFLFAQYGALWQARGDPNAWKHFRPELDRAWEPYTMPLGSEGMIAADLAHQINLTRINVRTHSQAG